MTTAEIALWMALGVATGIVRLLAAMRALRGEARRRS
jgi:hypothetical protein